MFSVNFLIHGPCKCLSPQNVTAPRSSALCYDLDPPSDTIRITGCVPSVDDFEVFVGFTCIIISETGEPHISASSRLV